MTDELENLRPEVREALERMIVLCSAANKTGKWMRADCDTVIIAELLRLATIEADALIALDCEHDWQVEHERAEKAEAELAALKAKIADAPIASVRVDDRMHVSIGARSCAVDFVPLHTKRVRLVVEE